MFHAEEIWTMCGLASKVRVTEASILARKQFGSVHESLRTTSPNNSLLNPVRFGQLTQDPAAGNSVSSCLSNGADANFSRMLDSTQAANSRTGISVCVLPSLVHMLRKAALKASCCCEAGSLAISRAWPTVIRSFRNASATGGIRSANRMRPYYVALLLMWR